MGSGNLKGKLVKKMTAKQIERISIIEERHNLCKEFSNITGEEITRRPVPDWRWKEDMPKTDREYNHSKSTLDKSKSINDDVEGNKVKTKVKQKPKGRTKRSSTTQKKKTNTQIVPKKPRKKQKSMIAFVSPAKSKKLQLDEDINNCKKLRKKHDTNDHNKFKSLSKINTTKLKTIKNNNMIVTINKTQVKTLQSSKEQIPFKKIKKPLFSKTTLLHLALLAEIRQNIQKGKQLNNKTLNKTNSHLQKRRLSIGQPADSDYEYEY